MSNSHDFCWADYLGLANELADRPHAEEAHFRSSISRAYYAAFHVAKQLAEREGFRSSGSGPDHRNVWLWYGRGRGTGIERRQIAGVGKRLRLDRDKADYDVPFGDDKVRVDETARLALKHASHIVKWVAKVQARQGGGGSPGASPA